MRSNQLPAPRKHNLSIFIPSSITLGSQDPRVKTLKVAQLARAAAIFRVNRILIYRDPQLDETKFITTVLEYLETPQYLRKIVFRKMPELRYIGLAPPLRTPHHPLRSKPRLGEYREGIVISPHRVDIGLDSPAILSQEAAKGKRVTVKISGLDPVRVELVDPSEVPYYWGYRVSTAPSLSRALEEFRSHVIFTGKEGRIVSLQDLARFRDMDLGVVFGSPARGIEQILAQEGRDYREFSEDFLNFIPFQGTHTVRTEEAVYIVLSILNLNQYAKGIQT